MPENPEFTYRIIRYAGRESDRRVWREFFCAALSSRGVDAASQVASQALAAYRERFPVDIPVEIPIQGENPADA